MALAREMAEESILTVRRLEQNYSRYLQQNILAEINEAGKQAGSIVVNDVTAGLLNYADHCYQHSGGLFDITSGVLRRAWNFKSGRLPTKTQIDSLLPLIGWEKVTWQAPKLSFQVSGMELDFGGVVKEYAADCCATLCLESGFKHGVINLGGDIRIIGPHANDEPWRIGIRHPRKPMQTIHQIPIVSGGICTSGDYERCIRLNGRLYSHILNPKTGWPVDSDLASVTVVADLCLVAGSLSTIAMLKGKGSRQWLHDSGLSAICVNDKGDLSIFN